MQDTTKKATKYTRMYPDTYERLRKLAFAANLTYPEYLETIIPHEPQTV